MMDEHERGKCTSNVVSVRLYIQTGMCVTLAVLKFLLSLLTHFILRPLLSTSLVLCSHYFVLIPLHHSSFI